MVNRSVLMWQALFQSPVKIPGCVCPCVCVAHISAVYHEQVPGVVGREEGRYCCLETACATLVVGGVVFLLSLLRAPGHTRR